MAANAQVVYVDRLRCARSSLITYRTSYVTDQEQNMNWLFWVLLIPVGWVLYRLLLVYLSKPKAHKKVGYSDLPPLLNEWAKTMAANAVLHIKHMNSDFSVEFRKKEYKSRPDTLLFRFRNSDSTKKYFPKILSHFQNNGIQHDLELTKKRKTHRAMVVTLEIGDESTAERGAELVEEAFKAAGFNADGELMVHSVGQMSSAYEKEVWEQVEKSDDKLLRKMAASKLNKLRAQK